MKFKKAAFALIAVCVFLVATICELVPDYTTNYRTDIKRVCAAYPIPKEYPSNNDHDRNDYAWINDSNILVLYKLKGQSSLPIFQFNDSNLTLNADNSLRPFAKLNADFISLSTDAKFAFLSDTVDQQWVDSRIAEIRTNQGGSVININVSGSGFYWCPNEPLFLHANFRHWAVFSPEQTNGFISTNAFMPDFLIGFSGRKLFIASTNQITDGGYPTNMDLEYWKIAPDFSLQASRRISIHGEEIVSASMSPNGDKILWLCYPRLRVKTMVRSDDFPYLHRLPESGYFVDFYLSSSEANEFQYLGSNVSDDFPRIRWAPDGSKVSFMDKNQFYVLPMPQH